MWELPQKPRRQQEGSKLRLCMPGWHVDNKPLELPVSNPLKGISHDLVMTTRDKHKALEMWREWEPDTLIVEKRAAGAPLIYEMRKMGIPMSEYTPGKGNDKISRVNAISDLFASGIVWCPETRWAEEVMDELASFPNGDHDDLVDSSSQALMRFRLGGFISIDSDEEDEPTYHRRKVEYY